MTTWSAVYCNWSLNVYSIFQKYITTHFFWTMTFRSKCCLFQHQKLPHSGTHHTYYTTRQWEMLGKINFPLRTTGGAHYNEGTILGHDHSIWWIKAGSTADTMMPVVREVSSQSELLSKAISFLTLCMCKRTARRIQENGR